MRSGNVPLDEIMKAAEVATLGKKENLDQLTGYLNNENSAVAMGRHRVADPRTGSKTGHG